VKFFVGGCNNYDMKQEVHKRIEIEMMPRASLTALAEKPEKFSSNSCMRSARILTRNILVMGILVKTPTK